MWQDLVKILLSNFTEGRVPRRRAAQAFMALHASMLNCQEAYVEHQSEGSPESSRRWDDARKALASLFSSLGHILHVYDSRVYGLLYSYVAGEFQDPPIDMLIEGALAKTARIPFQDGSDAAQGPEDFEEAVKSLATFIRENFSLKEVL